MSLDEIYNANLGNQEMHAFIALYQVLFESQEDKWEIWDSFARTLTTKERLNVQRKFEIYCRSDIYTMLTRVAIKKDGTIFKQAKSFAIDYCRRNEAFLYDLVD